MLRLHSNGYTSLVHNEENAICSKHLRRALIAKMVDQGLSIRQIAEVFGIHRNTASRLAKTDPHVEPIFGSDPWTPECQDQKPKSCTRCGGKIKPGSSFYCAACHATGHERRLMDERIKSEIQDAYELIEAEAETVTRRRQSLAKRRAKKRQL